MRTVWIPKSCVLMLMSTLVQDLINTLSAFMHWTWMHVHGHITSWHHSCKTMDQALSHAILDGNLEASALHKLLVSPTNSPRSACITHSYYIFGNHRHIVQLHWGTIFSESVLTWAAIALWSRASWHSNWRSSTIGEDVLSWWTVNPICYGHWGLREEHCYYTVTV